MVAHVGGGASGEYRYTLTMTDIATGWTVNRSVLNQARTRAVSLDGAVPEVLNLVYWRGLHEPMAAAHAHERAEMGCPHPRNLSTDRHCLLRGCCGA